MFRVWLLIAVVAGGVLLIRPGAPLTVRETVISSQTGKPLRVRLIEPGAAVGLRPALILVPPYCLPPDTMGMMAVECARRGIVCALPDFFGMTAAEARQRMGADSIETMTADMLSLKQALARMPGVDRNRIGICGQSVGGTVAVLAGMDDPSFAATIAIGIQVEAYPAIPRNLLIIAGLYDEFRSPDALIGLLKTHGVATNPIPDTVYGEFRCGTARMVSIIPTCDHFTEVTDPVLLHAVLRWCAASFDDNGLACGGLNEWWRASAAFMFTLAITVLAGMIAARTGLCAVQHPRGRHCAVHVPFLLLICAVTAAWQLGTRFAGFRAFAADLMVSLPIACSAASMLVRHAARGGTGPLFHPIRTACCVFIAFWASLMASWAILSLPAYWRWPSMIMWYPVFLANMIMPLHRLGMVLREWLFTNHVAWLQPALGYFVLLGSLALMPDWLMRLVTMGARGIAVAVAWRGTQAVPSRVTLRQVLLLAALIATLAWMLWRRAAEGMVTPETLALAGRVFLRFTVLPFLMLWLIIRARWFRRIAGLA